MTEKWWHDKIAYQIYPKSFLDSNGDGIGDLRGIISKLDYIKALGIDIIWLSPIYKSPFVDQGYDISDYYKIAEQFGTMDDFDTLVAEMKKRGMHLIMDLVVNHCSDKHEWFQKALADPDGPYAGYFYFREGKDGKGLYPASAVYSTDLHSIGQFIQEGTRVMFETVINVNAEDNFVIESDADNADGLNFLAGKTINFVNQQAFLGTVMAHTDGGVPNISIELTSRTARDFGYLVYFFELSCAVSGYMLGINPFNQPGVEAYKKNMFALLGKPGYEENAEELKKRLEKIQ